MMPSYVNSSVERVLVRCGCKIPGAFALAAVAASFGMVVSPAVAVQAVPGWSISSLAQPTNFSSSDNTTCEKEAVCDTYTLTVANTGSKPTVSSEEGGSPVTITDTLPPGLEVYAVKTRTRVNSTSFEPEAGLDWDVFRESIEEEVSEVSPTFGCVHTALTVTCTDEKAVPAGDVLTVGIVVMVKGAPGSVENTATVQYGSGSPVSTGSPSTVPNTVDGPSPAFGIQDFSFNAYNTAGAPDVNAGAHPDGVDAGFDLNSVIGPSPLHENGEYAPVQDVKDIVVDLPLGLVGNPLAAPRCTLAGIIGQGARFIKGITTSCPADSRVGTIVFNAKGRPESELLSGNTDSGEVSAVYNMVPEVGFPAEFGFNVLGVPVLMYASVVPGGSGGYMLRVAVPGVVRPGLFQVDGASLAFFGDPAAQDGGTGTQGAGSGTPTAFFTNPTDCTTGPLKAHIEVDSWFAPGNWQSKEATSYEANPLAAVNGCGLLQFDPTLELAPETGGADEPQGYDVDLKVPQATGVLGDLATPELKNATVTLPEGVTVSPSAADGLVGCQATGPEGIDIPHGTAHPDEAGEGEEIGPDGLSHLAKGHCPLASQIGTVEVVTPLLPEPLKGRVYVAQPKCGGENQPACTEAEAAAGNLFGLYIEAEGSGVIVKLAGSVSANPSTGRLTATFRENPQLPFSDLKLQFKGGPRAPLANPQSCGTYTTTSDLSSWASPEVPDATPSSSFEVGGCEGDPFVPAFSAGTVTPLGGGYSPFTLTFSRKDREQDLAGITVNTPPGLLGKIAGIEQCPEPQAANGTCGPNSLIGHTNVAAGAGSHPFWVSGNVFLTGPYKGAPFGLSVVVPTVAGPFKLAGSNGQGDDVVRAAIRVNPNTSALSVTSDPLPQIIDGVPLRIQTVNVTIDRPGFMFNPTNCAQQAITGTVTSAQGAAANVSSPFAVAGCANLPFKPSFRVSTQAKTSKANGASLDVKVGSSTGQANIAKVHVTLPKQLPARLTTLQKACTDTQFNANPAGCPAASIVGMAVAHTPVLANPLSGPAYLVSHGGVAFPDLVIVLQGEGITLVLDGNTNIKKGITTSTFNSVPDAPVSSFELKLPEGSHSVLATDIPTKAKSSMCGQALTMPTTITGQNGAVVTQTTKIGVTGCPKAKKAKAKKKKGNKKGNKGKGKGHGKK
jgi:hypothetical protein